MALSIISYNSLGLSDNTFEYLQDLSQKFDIALLQEHWLYDSEISQVSCKLAKNKLSSHIVSGMHATEFNQGRPYGGVAIIWRDDLDWDIKSVEVDSKRVSCVIMHKQNMRILICCVYMPCDDPSNCDEYEMVLNEMSEVCTRVNADHIIIGGDLNTDFRRKGYRAQKLKSYIANESMLSCAQFGCADIPYTYESKQNGTRSILDHFIVTENLFSYISEHYVIDHIDNTSDHLPLYIKFNIYVNYCEIPVKNNHSSLFRQYLWKSATHEQINAYALTLDSYLDNIFIPVDALNCSAPACNVHQDEINAYCNDIILSCLQASNVTIPQGQPKCSTSTFHRPGVKGWDCNLSQLKDTALFWHKLWKTNGSPSSGVVADVRCNTRRQYHDAIKSKKKDSRRKKAEHLANSYMSHDVNGFWAQVRKMKGNQCLQTSIIDGVSGSESICNVFANKFRQLFNSVGYDIGEHQLLNDTVNNGIFHACCNTSCPGHHSITFSDVKAALNTLKPLKHDGYLGFNSSHILKAKISCIHI